MASRARGQILLSMNLPQIDKSRWGERLPFNKKLLFACSGVGWDGRGDGAEDLLQLGDVYTATHIIVNAYTSYVELDECRGQAFNASCFVELEHLMEVMRE